MRSFMDGLKSRIKSEIGLLLALEEGVGGLYSGGGGGGGRDATNPLRKFLPMPLLKG